MKANSGSSEMTDADAAEVAAEIARLDILFGAGPDRLLTSETAPTLISNIRNGPLRRFLEDGDSTGQATLLTAKARLAVHDAYVARRRLPTPPSRPPWLTALIIPLILAIVVHFVTTQQQLALFRRQTSLESMRKQADVLLGHLTSIVVLAKQLKDDAADMEADQLTAGEADLLRNRALELEQNFATTVQLHKFDGFPELRKAELRAFYETRALQDCLQRAAGREPSAAWQKTGGIDQDALSAATSANPCAANFAADAFVALTDAVNVSIDQRIGGSLFPSGKIPQD